VQGKVEARDDIAKVICNTARSYDEQVEANAGPADTGAENKAATIGVELRGQDDNFYRLRITIPHTDDQDLETAQARHVHRLLTQEAGNDRFSFLIQRRDRVVEMDFPNVTTRYSVALEEALTDLLGEECVQVKQAVVGNHNRRGRRNRGG